jgi:hypothetical protein
MFVVSLLVVLHSYTRPLTQLGSSARQLLRPFRLQLCSCHAGKRFKRQDHPVFVIQFVPKRQAFCVIGSRLGSIILVAGN